MREASKNAAGTGGALSRRAAVAFRGAFLLLPLVVSGCWMFQPGAGMKPPMPLELALPLWLTSPQGDEQRSAPVMMGMPLPPELTPFGKRFADLPPWYVYGTVRCLGAEEFLASGVVRTHILHDGRAEYRCVSDSLRYNVDAARVEESLSSVTQAISGVQAADRDAVLRANLSRYSSGYGLFTLAGAGGQKEGGTETFRVGVRPECEPVGWQETASEFRVTQIGDFSYRDPLGALRRVEEDAIADLARGMLVRLAHLQKSAEGENENVFEETTRESLRVKIRGVRVLRRAVDLSEGTCFVTITVAKGGTGGAR